MYGKMSYALIAITMMFLTSCGGGGTSNSTGTGTGTTSATGNYTFSGTITGMAGGRQITLLNNGTSPITIMDANSFSYASSISAGTNYAITISNQPLNQICSVTNGNGNSNSSTISNVAISCLKLPSPVQSNGFVVPMWSYTNHSDALASLTTLKSNTKANSIIVDFHLKTSSLNGNDIAIQNPSLVEGLKDVLQIANTLGFDIWFKPAIIVGTNGVNWKDLAPTNPKLWFENYSVVLNQLAEIINPYHVSHYLITNELYSMTTSAAYSGYWSLLTASLRSKFSGQLGFNAGGLLGTYSTANEFLNIPTSTLNSIDFMGISAYPSLLAPQAYTTSAVMAAWSSDWYGVNLENSVNNFIKSNPSMPVFFTELGSPAYYGGNLSPVNSPDPLSQQNFYIGSLTEISTNMRKIDGVFIYDWALNSQSGTTPDGSLASAYAWDIYTKPFEHAVFLNQWSNVLYQQ